MSQPPTIYALSSGHGRAGVAVVRVSGPDAGPAVRALAGDLPAPRRAVVRSLGASDAGGLLDQALVLWFPGPASFTGEDLAEFHVHGGRAVIAGVLDALGCLPGLRPADAGEFTRRAFENGKLDLTQAEGLADLIDADTTSQRLQALRQMDGALARAADGWRRSLLTCAGLVEAAIDFSDESDVAATAFHDAQDRARSLLDELRHVLDDGRSGEIVRAGFTVVIAGPPNAGKSSLINVLSRRDVAIVSAEAGTTRDVVEVTVDVAGIPVLFMDTAGVRDASGDVEREGIRRTLGRARDADLVLWVEDATAVPAALPDAMVALGDRRVSVVNKIDLVSKAAPPGLAVSAATGAGIAELLQFIAARVRSIAERREHPLLTRARHRRLVEDAAASVAAFLAGKVDEIELRAEDLRRASTAIGRLSGRIDVEDVLGEIFGQFCIGK